MEFSLEKQSIINYKMKANPRVKKKHRNAWFVTKKNTTENQDNEEKALKEHDSVSGRTTSDKITTVKNKTPLFHGMAFLGL